jgi:hypothetical protein
MGCSSSLFYTEITLQREKIILPAARRLLCRPVTVLLGYTVQTSTCREQLNRSQLYFGQATYLCVEFHLYESGQSMTKFSNLSSRTRDWWIGLRFLWFRWRQDGHILINTRFWAVTSSLMNNVKRRLVQVQSLVTFADISDFWSSVGIWGWPLANESNL